MNSTVQTLTYLAFTTKVSWLNDILQDTILPQTENVKLQPIQVGELDKPIELKPEIDVPSELTKQKPEKKNTHDTKMYFLVEF